MRLAIVTLRPIGSTGGPYINLQRDLDGANQVFLGRCGVWIYCTASTVEFTNRFGSNVAIDQDDCKSGGFLGFGDHEVSDDEDALFDLGRDLGAAIVCYYIGGDPGSGLGGCAAHPDGREGFWVAYNSSRWMFGHELGHIVGGLDHVDNQDNLMWPTPGAITNPPPDLTVIQCSGPFGAVASDPDVETCS